MRVFQVFLLLNVFVLSSCANMQTGGRNYSDDLDNSGETAIFFQAVGIGAGVGLGVGLLACNKLEGFAKNLCIASTTAVGGGVGYVVAQQQINSINQVRLKNDQLEKLLNEAQQYNNKVAMDNLRLQQEISMLQTTRATKTDKLQRIMQQLQEARHRRTKVMEALNIRRRMTEKLSNYQQRNRYEATLGQLDSELSRLDNSIRELEQYEGQVRVGL